ncbi:TPA: undecaprenyl-diphosphate phosphatase [candidate division WWE3 bacterium]|uniref:Undecaprenyl-diphosphatase n=1 Tax=candidate division WWE3 bacterium TaxID=2053526 RepID=A0A656PM23_UNCKA|nr:UDP-diphosphatase [candidate division WWE3 bacterium RAAC2_WWE3_1]KKS29511.1 MAG: Undecaprenyl-diphosphatase [candidate division WWE3 bacterium GW2011_GWB1_42_117]KKS54883.1 MAG: Undecaprenyl-diphosphatase [candidate division WWE3 bacterium GW2011_GWD2_42_34]KKT05499.1 MAG: Undecaprenyl-diphosphatase [candidate division WWE3 bacterium GW2011_GWE2_43_18]KKT06748.1 MAG: Undecaprenyl-diphosphatase [candidate division WWE3 bacterium GW2011_GWF2_43_18]KKT08560.1 MAG: Undecaprenyl-diphosphatase [
MNIFSAILLGLIEGVTEFLPISSTGHMILVSDILKLPNTDFLKSFEIAIQVGAIFAIIVMYTPRFLKNIRVYQLLLFAFLPATIIGFLFYDFIKTYLFNPAIVSATLITGGVFLVYFDRKIKNHSEKIEKLEEISSKDAFIIGLSQTLAMIPGVSRAAATITGGVLRGLSKKQAMEFSFLLAVPTMLAATGYDLIKTSSNYSTYEFGLLGMGSIVSFVSAWIAVRLFIKIIDKHGLAFFGYYRIILGVVYLLYFQ